MNDYELYHHGIKGQKWGVRRYQDKSGRLTPAGKAHLRGDVHYENVFKDMKKYGRSSKGSPEDMIADAQAVNGGVRGFVMGFNRNVNCAFCATAYELRRRGQDVQAQESLQGVSTEATKIPYLNIKKSDIHTDATRKSDKTMHIGMTKDEFDSMEKSILKDGENSRGRMNVMWKAPAEGWGPQGGHALNYEVKDGKFYLVDSQVGKVLSGKDAYDYMSSAINVERFRTDNKRINDKVSSKYFVENNSNIRINTEMEAAYKSAERDKKIQAGVSFAATASTALLYIGAGTSPALAASGVAGLGVSAVVSSASTNSVRKHTKKADEAQSKASLELEKQWEDEKRWKVYNEGKVKGGKKK